MIRERDVIGFARQWLADHPDLTEDELRKKLQWTFHCRPNPFSSALQGFADQRPIHPVAFEGCILGLVFLPIFWPLFSLWDWLTRPAPGTINAWIEHAIGELKSG